MKLHTKIFIVIFSLQSLTMIYASNDEIKLLSQDKDLFTKTNIPERNRLYEKRCLLLYFSNLLKIAQGKTKKNCRADDLMFEALSNPSLNIRQDKIIEFRDRVEADLEILENNPGVLLAIKSNQEILNLKNKKVLEKKSFEYSRNKELIDQALFEE